VGSHRFGAPTLGQHNSGILGEELGSSTKEIEALASNEENQMNVEIINKLY
jgi:hypothetical protein